ncbi:hypothetical protein CRYUN_Cryun04dG0147700 [Craigia yunnanensis]
MDEHGSFRDERGCKTCFQPIHKLKQLSRSSRLRWPSALRLTMFNPFSQGLAVGAGWQAFVAYINIGCYTIFGIPLGLALGFKFDMGVKGIWFGKISGTVVQLLSFLG